MTRSLATRSATLIACAATLIVAGCSKTPTEPLTLGYVAGLTGRTADLGTSGRNGVQLAIEQANAAGGVNGREIRLLIKDDTSNPDEGKKAVAELVNAKVAAIVGPMTSAVSIAVAPLATEAGILMMAGSVTTKELAGKDDYFFRAIATTEQHALTMANFLFEKRKVRSVHLLVNLANRSYTESWATDFTLPFEKLGGKVARIDYPGGDDTRFDELAKKLVAGAPDAIILITNALDASSIGTQLLKLGSKSLHVTSEWAGTGKLTELGGQNVEGYIVPQYLDPTSKAPAYLEFRRTFVGRFQHEPGFPAMAGFNATNVVLRGLREQRKGETLKETLLRLRDFEGTQERISFDNFGDVKSATHITEIKDGSYINTQ